jgi:putative ABC transport system ATP-binding protein
MLVEFKKVSKTYHSGENSFEALKEVDFQLQKGEMIAVVGASGSGKSTLMNIIGFLDRCTTGTYHFSGQEVSHLADQELASIRNQKIGFIFQSFFLLPRLNALQNVMLPLFYRGISKPLAEEKALNMLAKVKMEKFVTHRPNQLSGGQQQRVAIARALVGEPEVILADEPTGSLDSKTGGEIMQFLIELNEKEKRTLMIVTHDQAVSHLCQREVVLKDGVIQG